MSQPVLDRQQILTIALAAFNQYGDAFTLDRLAVRLSVPPSSLYPYFSSKPELIRQLVSFTLDGIRQTNPKPPQRSLAVEFQYLFATYQKALTSFSQTALLDLKLHYPEEWAIIRQFRENHWQKIADILQVNITSGRLRPINIVLLQGMVDGMLQEPFLLEASTWCSEAMPLSLPELVDIFLFGIVRRAP
ncbi:MAG TPA: TetR/AcrR family transcriptional regulator [Methylomusa anaerophila]|uniref:HTH tetR-type domain-containing protein n=1 Tax=Methylomusa anaerophila TaxID=1930071 RepID=A0A348AQK0_9FIRM|nr:TetR/AcrR family transcriptional regulator [Methylomusa anaerophila]BBB93348.1 hypothetical protein MAMMFC1_04060 [Methylomusa anaerophila]HML86822.1 TetR/AcrR family transcriptional regulator [Methylomusa anaerophila]